MHSIIWLDRRSFLLLHYESLAFFGGLQGFRDEGLLDSALTRPQQILNYRSNVTLPELAAAYAAGISRNPPFLDGNKRAALLAMTLFCRLNGWSVETPKPEAIALTLALAAGELTEDQLATWVAQHLVQINPA